MNIIDKHSEKVVSAHSLFKGVEGSATAIQIIKGEQLKEHIAKTEAFLICINRSAGFENEKEQIHSLNSGDCVLIKPMIKHWVDGVETSQMVLLK